jgi:hypothetical protein
MSRLTILASAVGASRPTTGASFSIPKIWSLPRRGRSRVPDKPHPCRQRQAVRRISYEPSRAPAESPTRTPQKYSNSNSFESGKRDRATTWNRHLISPSRVIEQATTRSVRDEVYQEAKQHFTDKELVNLTLAITQINVWNRFNVAFRKVAGSYQPDVRELKKSA